VRSGRLARPTCGGIAAAAAAQCACAQFIFRFPNGQCAVCTTQPVANAVLWCLYSPVLVFTLGAPLWSAKAVPTPLTPAPGPQASRHASV